MAHCSVLEAHQKATDRPSKRIKRSGGHSLVNHGLAIWIVRNVLLKMIPANANPNRPQFTGLIAKPFIPINLPSHKAPGTKAIGPVAEQIPNCRATIRLANQLAR